MRERREAVKYTDTMHMSRLCTKKNCSWRMEEMSPANQFHEIVNLRVGLLIDPYFWSLVASSILPEKIDQI
jgi:hypothetical protein